MKSSSQKYYLVSDLHTGGDGALQHCDYAAEFIEFLKGLEKEGPDTELTWGKAPKLPESIPAKTVVDL